MTVFPNRLRFHSDSQVLYVLGLMTPIVASIAPLQISTVAVLAALAVLLRRLAAGHIWLPLNVTKLSGVLLALVLWGAITTIWSIDYLLGIGTASRLLLASLTLLILLDAVSELDAESQKQLYIWLSLGAAIGITLTLVSVFYIYIDTVWFQQKEMAEHELSAFNRTASILAMLTWPWALAIYRSRGLITAIAFLLVAATTIYLLAPLTPFIAFGLGCCAFVLGFKRVRLATSCLLAGFALCIIVIPFLPNLLPWLIEVTSAHLDNPINLIHRFAIWQFASEHIMARPIIGWGLDAARVFPGGNIEIVLFEAPSGHAIMGPALPLHTHNAIIQIWLEMGVGGVLLITTLFSLIIKSIRDSDINQPGSAISIAVITSGLTISQLGFGFWQGWWLATLGITAILTTASVRQCSPPEQKVRDH